MSKREREARKTRQVNASGWAKKSEERGEATAIKLPAGIEFYKLTVGTHAVDFIPYITGKGNPQADEGFPHFEREFTDHYIPTPNGKSASFLCLWSNFKKPCPICRLVNSNAVDDEFKKSAKGKLRHLWLVNDKPGNPENKLKIFTSNHYNRGQGFGEMMVDAINSVSKYSDFSDLEKGMTLQLTVKEQSIGEGKKYNAITRIDFLPRDYSYPEEIMDNAPCLDSCLVEQSSSFLDKLLNQEVEEPDTSDDEPEEKEETPPPAKAAAKKVKEPEPEDETDDDPEEMTAEDAGITVGCTVDHEELGTCEVVHVSGDKTSLKLKDAKGKVHTAIDPDECEMLDDPSGLAGEDEEEEIPLPKKPGKKPPVIEDDEDSLDDEPPAKKPAPPTKGKKVEVEEDEDDSDLFEDSDLDDEEPEEKPVKKSKK